MNENSNHHFPEQNLPVEQAPSSLMPALLARLNLDRPEQAPAPTLVDLKAALTDHDWTVRAEAVQRLADSSDRASFELLLAAVNDQDESVRAVAVRVLGKRGDPMDRITIERLEAALRDPAWHVRETAAYALGAVGSRASILALRDALRDSDDEVRRAAAQAIRNLQRDAREEELRESVQTSQIAGARSPWIHAVTRLVPRSFPTRERKIAMLDEQNAAIEETSSIEEIVNTSEKPAAIHPAKPRRPWLRVLEQGLAALLVLSIICGWLIVSHLPRSSSGSGLTFSEAGARSLGAPIATIHGNRAYASEWSPDSRVFVTLEVNTQMHELEAQILDTATGHSSINRVLDSSWIAAINANDPFTILQGRYLLAMRAQSKNLATMVIWDIIEGHAVTTRTVPAYAPLGQAGQVLSPWIRSSTSEQKFAMYAPDGTVSIWDVASGQKLITCQGKLSANSRDSLPIMGWYDHDQSLLISIVNSQASIQLAAWNTTTGTRLFAHSESHKSYVAMTTIQVDGMALAVRITLTPETMLSPDNKYLALLTGSTQKSSNTNTKSVETLEILDAHSGQVLHTYNLNESADTGTEFSWLPDSRHLLTTSSNIHDLTPSHTLPEQMDIWDIFTGQTTPMTSVSNTGSSQFTPDHQYLILNSPNGRVMQIWQPGSRRLVATVATPGISYNAYSYTAVSNRYMLIGLKDHFDLWDITTGKLVYKYHGFTPASVSGVDSNGTFWSPNGKYLAMISETLAPSDNGYLEVWRIP